MQDQEKDVWNSRPLLTSPYLLTLLMLPFAMSSFLLTTPILITRWMYLCAEIRGLGCKTTPHFQLQGVCSVGKA